MSRRRRGDRFIRFDVDDAGDLARLTRDGLIWRTPYIEQGIEAVRSGVVRLDECRDLPDHIRAILAPRQDGG